VAEFSRNKDGERLDFHGVDLLHAPDVMPPGRFPMAINIRAYKKLAVIGRNLLTNALYTLASAVHSLKRLNDSSPNAPASGYSIINGASTVLSAWNSTIGVKTVATGLSGNPVSMVPFRPNTSVQAVMYVADSAAQGSVTLETQYLGANSIGPSGTPVNFVSNGMMKVSCNDGYTGTPTPTAVCWKMGIAEPPLAPIVSTANSGVTTTGTLAATAIPWTNYTGANSGYNYGHNDAYHGQPGGIAPFDGTVWYSIDVVNASTVTINSLVPVGTVTINSTPITTQAGLAATSSGRVAATYPGQYLQNSGVNTHPTVASYIVGAFVDATGAVMVSPPGWQAPLYVPTVFDVGANIGTEITVPSGAVAFQVGINSYQNTFDSNSGSITLNSTVTTNALPVVTSTLGTMSISYFGDSPTVVPTSAYIWRNPDDPGGSGPTRSISDAAGTSTGNSFIFDATFAAGIPGLPGIGNGNISMQWFQLNSNSVNTGSIPVFAAPIITPTLPNGPNPPFSNFNFCLTGSIYFPSGGPEEYYTLVLTSHDDCIWGIGGGVTLVPGSVSVSGSGEGSSASISGYGQTITVVGGYPLLPRQNYTHGDDFHYAQTTLQVNPPSAGIYPIEIDYDYWYRNGRILLLEASPTAGESPTIIPPLAAGVKQQVQYRYVYRSSATGAQSNPSPESTAETIPVTANTITSIWSPDPQVDVVDYYRLDSVVSNFTYVNTGPNDNLGGGGTNTPVTDSLLDTELGTQLLEYDNFEPFPSIDLPQKGVCNVSGGAITWVSGGAIGGSATGFNIRWLAGTIILIGSPTSLAYTFIARPTAAAFQAGYLYPLNFFILDPAGHYQLVTVSGTSGGTTPVFNDTGGNTISGGVTFTDKGIYLPTGYVTEVTIPGVPDGTNLAYEIPEPILAAQPLPYLFGPTDNVNFCFGVGDPLRPGTLYWCKGSNLDAAPDTNQTEVCSPAEPLVNGAIAGGLGVLFSIKRAWLIVPSSGSAVAAATGTIGNIWNLQESSITRGLYIPRCVCVSGGGLIYFRVDDGIHVSSYGSASKSITDQDLYPLFQHENAAPPTAVTIAGYTIYPPDDTQPNLQRFSIQGAYMYWDYYGIDGHFHTFVFDEAAMGWVPDSYTPPATIHAPDEGQSVGETLVGCSDGTVRLMSSAGTEVATAVLLTPCTDFGDTRATKHIGDLYIESVNP
jgi:hypothetical protein